MAIGKSPLQTRLENIPPVFRNKYFLALVFFFGWILFFDKHNLVTQVKLHLMVKKLEQDKAYYSNKVKEAEQVRNDMDINREKFAREHYYLQARDEDVLIIKDADELK